jgi:DNA polymerase I
MLDLKRRVSIDIETNALINPTLIHCIVCTDIDSGEVFKFRPNSPLGGHHDFKDEFLKFSEQVCLWVGHNIIGFDMIQINRLLNTEVIKLDDVIDTLVLSRLFMPTSPASFKKGVYNRTYGHSLDSWGKYLNKLKFEYDDWSKYSEEMLKYCVQDTKVCIEIYHELWHKERQGFSDESIKLEHQVAYMLKVQEDNGFYLDQEKALKLFNETGQLLTDMLESLQILFPPEFKFVRNLPLKLNKDGSKGSVFTRILTNYENNPNLKAELREDGSYDLYQKESFNPNSANNIAERLLSIGWKPKNYTDKGNIKTDKKSLEEAIFTLLQENSHMESLRCLANYSIVGDRHQKAEKWLELAREDGRVHGKVNPIGAGTHRCSHYDDNMANIARVVSVGIKRKDNEEKYLKLYEQVKDLKKFDRFDNNKVLLHATDKEIEFALTGLEGSYGWDSRDCWGIPSADLCLVGADASGIQLRALAHYMNDKDYIKKLLEGDIHTVNQLAAGISTRNKAKTFIYAWLLGGGDEKIGSIVGVTPEEYDELFAYAKAKKKWNSNLFDYTKKSLKDKGRKVDRKTVATIIKGFKTKEQFLDRTPALKRLKKKDIPKATKQGYLLGLDGRKLWIPNEHLAMSLYLQGFEAVIMKKAMYLYQKELREKGIPFKQVAMVHDEFQIETPKEYGDIVGKAVVNAIRVAGEFYHSNCPLDGEYKIGTTWATTH